MVFTTTQQPATNRRRIPWPVICAVRAEWAAVLASEGVTPVEYQQWSRGERTAFGAMLRDEGKPCLAELGRRYGILPPLLSVILAGRAYEHPPDVAKHIAGVRAMAKRKAAR